MPIQLRPTRFINLFVHECRSHSLNFLNAVKRIFFKIFTCFLVIHARYEGSDIAEQKHLSFSYLLFINIYLSFSKGYYINCC